MDTKHMMNRIELKQEAKGVVRTAAVSAYLFALLYLALTELLPLCGVPWRLPKPRLSAPWVLALLAVWVVYGFGRNFF